MQQLQTEYPDRQQNLALLERQLDPYVLQNISSKDPNPGFERTVMAIFNIVEDKLYKLRSHSLEQYFRDTWKISRAQVYRFYNCARLLKELHGFRVLPSRERLCRSLKRIAHNQESRRILWQSVLDRTQGDESLITTATLTNVWADLVRKKLVTEPPPPAAGKIRRGDEFGSEDDGFEDDAFSPSSGHSDAPAHSVFARGNYPPIPPNQNRASISSASSFGSQTSYIPTEDIQTAIVSIKKLQSCGIQLEVLIDNRWISGIQDFRFQYVPAPQTVSVPQPPFIAPSSMSNPGLPVQLNALPQNNNALYQQVSPTLETPGSEKKFDLKSLLN